jgi:hypothetical protein
MSEDKKEGPRCYLVINGDIRFPSWNEAPPRSIQMKQWEWFGFEWEEVEDEDSVLSVGGLAG